MQPPYPTFKAALERIAELEAKLKAQVDSDEIDWVQCRARIAELETELRNIANANLRDWHPSMGTPEAFMKWAQSRACHALKAKSA